MKHSVLARPTVALVASGLAVALLAGTRVAAQQEKRVDVSVPRATVRDAVRALGDAAGLRLSAADGPVASWPVLLYVRGRPARAVMDDLASFLSVPGEKSIWEAAEGGFRLQQDAVSRAVRLQREQKARAERDRRLKAEFDTLLRLSKLNGAALERERARHPELAATVRDLALWVTILEGLSPEYRRTLLSGTGLAFRIRDLEPAQRQAAEALIAGRGRHRQRRPVPPELGGGHMDWDSERDVPRTPVSFRLTGDPNRPGISIVFITLPGSRSGAHDILHPGLPKELQPPWLREILEQRRQEEEAARRPFLERVKQDPAVNRKITLAGWQDLPDPKQPGKTLKRASDLSAALLQVADQTGLSIIGDYDPCWWDYYTRTDAHEPWGENKWSLTTDLIDVPAWEAMEHIAKYFRVEWEKRGDVLYVRSPRVLYAVLDGIDLLDPPSPPNYWQKLLRTYKPGDRLPGVTYDK
jgi:hypothetical protein